MKKVNSDKIKSITINNFQSIKHADIDLGDITVITGDSRTGKSAFFRSAESLSENETGEDFITIGETQTNVWFDDIAWIQSKTKNQYNVCGEIFDKCGRDVPEKVREFLGMGPVEFGKDVKRNLNFYSQLGQIFLVQGKGSDNAKIIGSISNLDIIYNALREAEKDTKNAKKEINRTGDQIKVDAERLKELKANYDQLDEVFHKAEAIYIRAKEIDTEITGINRCLDDIAREQKNEKEYRELNDLYKTIDLNSLSKKAEHLQSFSRLLGEISSLTTEIESVRASQGVFKAISLEKLSNTLSEYESLLELVSEFNMVDADRLKFVHGINQINLEIEHYQSELDKIETCPECGAEKKYWKI